MMNSRQGWEKSKEVGMIMFKNPCLITIIAILMICVISCVSNPVEPDDPLQNPVEPNDPLNDFIGSWIITGEFLKSGVEKNLLVQINEIKSDTEIENNYQMSGCMQSEDLGNWAPLSMQGLFDEEANNYEINLLSTLLLPEEDTKSVIIHFVGNSKLFSPGKDDDLAEGISYSGIGEIEWHGVHINSDVLDCPQVIDEILHFQGEVGNSRDLAFSPPQDVTNFFAETNIVSYQIQVELPDGQLFLVPYHTDIFSPTINFIDSFRFAGHLEGAPLVNKRYRFKLLDITGEPIPGAESFDTYIFCDHGAATNTRMVFEQKNFLEVIWDSPELIPDRFDPENGNGVFQIILEKYPINEGGLLYGAEMYTPSHKIPWNPFEAGVKGLPEGFDYGVSLSELEDGMFSISVTSSNYYEPAEGEVGFDCGVRDSSQNLIFEKLGSTIIQHPNVVKTD
jgi:hypothetical protein